MLFQKYCCCTKHGEIITYLTLLSCQGCLLICQNTTMEVYGPCSVLCSKAHSISGNLLSSPTSLRQATSSTRIFWESYIPPCHATPSLGYATPFASVMPYHCDRLHCDTTIHWTPYILAYIIHYGMLYHPSWHAATSIESSIVIITQSHTSPSIMISGFSPQRASHV